MEWIERERNVSDSTTWGNYYNRAYTITSETEYYNGSWNMSSSDIKQIK